MSNLPATVVLNQKPDGYHSQHYPLTVGKEYAVRGEMGSCLVIDSDEPGQTASVHWSRFLPRINIEELEPA